MYCPIQKSECIEHDCALYVKHEDKEHDMYRISCAYVHIAHALRDIAYELKHGR